MHLRAPFYGVLSFQKMYTLKAMSHTYDSNILGIWAHLRFLRRGDPLINTFLFFLIRRKKRKRLTTFLWSQDSDNLYFSLKKHSTKYLVNWNRHTKTKTVAMILKRLIILILMIFIPECQSFDIFAKEKQNSKMYIISFHVVLWKYDRTSLYAYLE